MQRRLEGSSRDAAKGGFLILCNNRDARLLGLLCAIGLRPVRYCQYQDDFECRTGAGEYSACSIAVAK